MSRLESFINRMTAQKILLEHVAEVIGDVTGPILELGLGNGRTYDHLRQIFPGCEIFAFDRVLVAHPACIPDAHHMIFGEIRETLAFCAPRIGGPAAFVHCDLGSGDPTMDLATGAWLAPMIVQVLQPGGHVLSGLELGHDSLETLALPPQIRPGRYFHYRKTG
ncbi:class I SAM-dependent methyltransferase [Polymorphum gilvum]|uniref:Hypothetical conserved protein n=1 Tax=Polymorphum gilvum (strain LMG 25793 / CGMCC 1.9160 / SL003B-26A1) TaxID=991905 RepID=F2J6E2_POLGS|nr:class I SAM-dependent methyltransferase [Polymorphum gilvum]ADZ71316.1 Hypothetical conserved protein [Polymorphum gilvum SL003B-26A1]